MADAQARKTTSEKLEGLKSYSNFTLVRFAYSMCGGACTDFLALRVAESEQVLCVLKIVSNQDVYVIEHKTAMLLAYSLNAHLASSSVLAPFGQVNAYFSCKTSENDLKIGSVIENRMLDLPHIPYHAFSLSMSCEVGKIGKIDVHNGPQKLFLSTIITDPCLSKGGLLVHVAADADVLSKAVLVCLAAKNYYCFNHKMHPTYKECDGRQQSVFNLIEQMPKLLAPRFTPSLPAMFRPRPVPGTVLTQAQYGCPPPPTVTMGACQPYGQGGQSSQLTDPRVPQVLQRPQIRPRGQTSQSDTYFTQQCPIAPPRQRCPVRKSIGQQPLQQPTSTVHEALSQMKNVIIKKVGNLGTDTSYYLVKDAATNETLVYIELAHMEMYGAAAYIKDINNHSTFASFCPMNNLSESSKVYVKGRLVGSEENKNILDEKNLKIMEVKQSEAAGMDTPFTIYSCYTRRTGLPVARISKETNEGQQHTFVRIYPEGISIEWSVLILLKAMKYLIFCFNLDKVRVPCFQKVEDLIAELRK